MTHPANMILLSVAQLSGLSSVENFSTFLKSELKINFHILKYLMYKITNVLKLGIIIIEHEIVIIWFYSNRYIYELHHFHPQLITYNVLFA